jgi:hypothetical protein
MSVNLDSVPCHAGVMQGNRVKKFRDKGLKC